MDLQTYILKYGQEEGELRYKLNRLRNPLKKGEKLTANKSEYHHQYYLAHKEKYQNQDRRAYREKWLKANPDYYHNYYLANKERYQGKAEYARQYYQLNRERILEYLKERRRKKKEGVSF